MSAPVLKRHLHLHLVWCSNSMHNVLQPVPEGLSRVATQPNALLVRCVKVEGQGSGGEHTDRVDVQEQMWKQDVNATSLGRRHPTLVHCLQVATPDKRRELLSHSLLKSYQTQASAQGATNDLTVGLLVPHVSVSPYASAGILVMADQHLIHHPSLPPSRHAAPIHVTPPPAMSPQLRYSVPDNLTVWRRGPTHCRACLAS